MKQKNLKVNCICLLTNKYHYSHFLYNFCLEIPSALEKQLCANSAKAFMSLTKIPITHSSFVNDLFIRDLPKPWPLRGKTRSLPPPTSLSLNKKATILGDYSGKNYAVLSERENQMGRNILFAAVSNAKRVPEFLF